MQFSEKGKKEGMLASFETSESNELSEQQIFPLSL
jgi:hypothetical protein